MNWDEMTEKLVKGGTEWDKRGKESEKWKGTGAGYTLCDTIRGIITSKK